MSKTVIDRIHGLRVSVSYCFCSTLYSIISVWWAGSTVAMHVDLVNYILDQELVIASAVCHSASSFGVKERWHRPNSRQASNLLGAEAENMAPVLGAKLMPKCYWLGYCDDRESCGIFPAHAS